MSEIPLQTYVHAALERKAKTEGLTPSKLASRIILRKSAEKTCHSCGLEAEDCPENHIPCTPDKFPCSSCLRNLEVKRRIEIEKKQGLVKLKTTYPDIDRWDECWTLNEKGEAFIER